MIRLRPAVWSALGLAVLAAALILTACSGSEPTRPIVAAAKGGSGNPSVNATNPDSARRNTTLDVHVLGSQFDQGSSAQWALAGVPSPKVKTNSTTYVSSTELLANITIAADADTVKYDVIVTAATGKKGIGSELFTVKALPIVSTPVALTVDDQGLAGPYKIKSDGLGEYVDGQQGMFATIDGYGNLQVTPANMNSSTPPQRTLRFDYSAPMDPLNSYRPDETGQWNFKIAANASNTGNPAIQQLGQAGNPASACYPGYIAHSNRVTQVMDDFNVNTEPQGTFVYITRTSIVPAEWTMVSDGPCPVNANWAGLKTTGLTKHSGGWVFRGYYNQQFSIRFRTK